MNATRFFKSNAPALLIAALILTSVASSANHAGAVYAISSAADSAAIPAAEGLQDLSSRMVILHSDDMDAATLLPEGTDVLIRTNGEEFSAEAQSETLSALLDRLEICPGPLDTTLVDASGEQLVVTIGAEPTAYDQVVESIAYKTVRKANPDLPKGKERVAQAGVEGTRTSTYEVVFFNGKELDRQLVEEHETPATDEIIEYGTAVEILDSDDRLANVAKNEDGSGVLTFRSGATLKFTDVKNVTATAYTAGRGGAGYITASGTPARVGAVAVDRRVIPLGSKLYIVTDDGKYVYGLAVAEDTGVIGNRVDLYYDDYDECIKFGRRAATIYILED